MQNTEHETSTATGKQTRRTEPELWSQNNPGVATGSLRDQSRGRSLNEAGVGVAPDPYLALNADVEAMCDELDRARVYREFEPLFNRIQAALRQQAADVKRFSDAHADAAVHMHRLLMDLDAQPDCGFGTSADWYAKASASIAELRKNTERYQLLQSIIRRRLPIPEDVSNTELDAVIDAWGALQIANNQ